MQQLNILNVVDTVEPHRPMKNTDSHLSSCMSLYRGLSGVSKEQLENTVLSIFQVVAIHM